MADYGVDLGSRRVALACVETMVFDELHLTASDCEWGGVTWKLHTIGWWVHNRTTTEDTLWVEAPILGESGNAQTAIAIAMVAAAVITGHPGPSYLVASARWKARVLGHGHADKHDIAAWLDATCPQVAAACGQSQDLRDAACLSIGGPLLAPAE